ETGVRTIEGKDWGVMDELGGLGEDQIFQNMEWEQENITVVYFMGRIALRARHWNSGSYKKS
ncbi:hypothetical protein KJ780_02935, partial [Candidatus Micrarchaeota archaeon]|nr:hypothetical protein [Candidatus Micrarchaeota archaeon]